MPLAAQGAADVGIFAFGKTGAGAASDIDLIALTIQDSLLADLPGFPVALPPIVRITLGEYRYGWDVPSDLPLGEYTVRWSGVIGGNSVVGFETWEVVPAGSIETGPDSMLTASDVQARMPSAPEDTTVLQEIIDEEEDWLAHAIGPLTGSRTETFLLAGFGAPRQYEVRLRRPTDAVLVEDNGATLDPSFYEIRGAGRIVARRLGKTAFYGPVSVTYVPNDTLRVRSALYQLIGLRLAEVENPSGFSSELMGSYQYQKAEGAAQRRRKSILRALMGNPRATSLHVRSQQVDLPPISTVRG